MIVRAPRPDGNFYILDKRISEDRRLSWAARGLLIFLLGKPNHWRVSVPALQGETKGCAKATGRDGVLSLLSELLGAGYAHRTQRRCSDGTLGTVDYVISEAAQAPLDEVPVNAPPPHTAKPVADQPQRPSPEAANPHQVSIEGRARTPKKKESARGLKVDFDFVTGTFIALSPALLDKWQASYPRVNVTHEIQRASAWLVSNPSHAKKDYPRFLNGWLSRAQDRAVHPAPTRGPALSTPRRASRAERGEAWGRALYGTAARLDPFDPEASDVIEVPTHAAPPQLGASP